MEGITRIFYDYTMLSRLVLKPIIFSTNVSPDCLIGQCKHQFLQVKISIRSGFFLKTVTKINQPLGLITLNCLCGYLEWKIYL